MHEGLHPQGWAPPVPPSSPVGTLSPDGAWRWDGVYWVPTGAPRPAPRGQGAPLRDATLRARFAIAGLLASGLAEVLSIVAGAGRVDLTNRLLAGVDVSATEATNSDKFVQATAYFEIAATLATAIAFLMWLHRVVANNHAQARWRLRFTPGWAVGWWFIPFANLVRVPQVMAETWRATAAAAEPRADGTPGGRAPMLLIVAWFGSSMLGSALARVAFNLRTGSQAGIQSLHDATVLDMAASGVTLLSAVLAVVLVARITARQNRLAAAASQDSSAA